MEFLSAQTRSIVKFIKNRFMLMPEFLFADSDTAVFRKGAKKKWCAVIMCISKRKLGINSDEKVEVLNVKLQPNDIALLIDNKRYFPAYHMNKNHWCTIVLNGTVEDDEIYFRIEQSYNLVKGD